MIRKKDLLLGSSGNTGLSVFQWAFPHPDVLALSFLLLPLCGLLRRTRCLYHCWRRRFSGEERERRWSLILRACLLHDDDDGERAERVERQQKRKGEKGLGPRADDLEQRGKVSSSK